MKKLFSYYWHSLRSRLPIFKLVVGAIVALVMSFTFYFFSCALMEAFRLLSVTPEWDIWRPSEGEREFYQLVFAFVSAILAQSFCLAYWFDRPRRASEKGHRSAVMIVNGQRNLNWYFLSWMAKVVLSWFIIFGTFPGCFYAFSLYPDYNYLFVLLVVVLFLQPWVEMRRAFKRKTWKWMALSAFLIVVFALIVSKINLIDYKTHDEIVLSRNVYHNYDIELPATEAFENNECSLSKEIYLVQPKGQNVADCQIIVDNKTVDLRSLAEVIDEWRWKCNPADYPLLSCRLVADKSLKMKDVNKVRKALAVMKMFRISYAVVPKHLEMDVRYYTFLSFPMRVPIWFVDSSYYQDALERVGKFSNQIVVRQISTSQIAINDVSVNCEEFKPALKHLIQSDLDYVVCLQVDDDMLFADYMFVVTSTKEILNELAEEYALENYSTPLFRLEYYKEEEVLRQYRFCFFEINDALSKQQ